MAETYRDAWIFAWSTFAKPIAEGGAESEWQSTINIKEGISLAPARTLPEKQDHAALCLRKLDLPFPAVVDGMDGAAENRLPGVAQPPLSDRQRRQSRLQYTARRARFPPAGTRSRDS